MKHTNLTLLVPLICQLFMSVFSIESRENDTNSLIQGAENVTQTLENITEIVENVTERTSLQPEIVGNVTERTPLQLEEEHVTKNSNLLRKKGSAKTSMEKKLIKTLLAEYADRGKMGRPIAEQNETLTVYYGLSLIQILDLDERNQVLSTNVWATYAWDDIYLSWDPELFGNITKVRVPSETVWQPDIKLYNYADERLEEKRDALVVVEYDGKVQWLPQAIYKSSCSIDIQYFPFDMQVCKMKFGSWTYDGSKINLELLYNNVEGFEFSDYIGNNEWTIVGSHAKRNVIKYTCCPGEPFIDITFQLHIRRQPAFYNYILILPCILLSSLTLVLFWLPPESPAKMQLGMNIFVAFFVLLLLLAESTPPAASSIPLIGAYYCLNMIMITLSTFLSVVVVNLYFHGARTEVPVLVKKIMINVVARIFCMRSQVIDASEKITTQKKQLKMNNDRVYGEQCSERLMYADMQANDNTWRVSNGVSGVSGVCPEHSQIGTLQSELKNSTNIENDIKDIKGFLRTMMSKQIKKERQEKIAKEWKLVALVLDRLFFFGYLLIIIVSISTVFDFVLFGKDGNSSQ